MGRVPLARRNLLAEPRRLLAGVAGIGLALMLILLLGGLWAGIQAQSARYVDATGAALWVLPPGTRTLFAEGTQPSASTLETVRRTALQRAIEGRWAPCWAWRRPGPTSPPAGRSQVPGTSRSQPLTSRPRPRGLAMTHPRSLRRSVGR
jgi:hypothetical protein